MSLEQGIKHRKEHRKPYHDARRWDMTCRNHGACAYCRRNRTIDARRIAALARIRAQS